jgi:hypothetical protein
MKIDKPINANYCATVVRIKNLVPLENCDNLVGSPIFGFQVITGKDTQIGDIGIFFPAEVQLSDEFCYHNNMYRHGDKNQDESKKGYLEDNRRVKAIKFRGNVSNGLFMPLSSLAFTGIDITVLDEGDEFDVLNGVEICRKYEIARRISNKGATAKEKKFNRVDAKHLPEHYSSDNFFKWADTLDKEKQVIVTQKIHGTSIRIGHTIVKRKFSIFEKFLSMVGVQIQPTSYDYVYGSRKVIKDINNPHQNHFYDTDIWTQEGKKLEGLLPENYIVFAELVGWTPELREIQKNYTYSIPQGSAELYIYRIAIINSQGVITDLAWDQVKEFCTNNGLRHVPELWRGKLGDLVIENFMDKRFFEEGYKHCLYLGDNKEIVDEGVCVRFDGIMPRILKAKSPKFLEHETALLDEGVEDLESSQNVEIV